jgi:hypothetical protein
MLVVVEAKTKDEVLMGEAVWPGMTGEERVPVHAAFIGQQATLLTASAEQTSVVLQQSPGALRLAHARYPGTEAQLFCLFTSSKESASARVSLFCAGVSEKGSMKSTTKPGAARAMGNSRSRALETFRILRGRRQCLWGVWNAPVGGSECWCHLEVTQIVCRTQVGCKQAKQTGSLERAEGAQYFAKDGSCRTMALLPYVARMESAIDINARADAAHATAVPC